MPKIKETPKVSIYDPDKDAYREITLEQAKKYIASLEEVKKKVAEMESEE